MVLRLSFLLGRILVRRNVGFMVSSLTLRKTTNIEDLKNNLRKIIFRGLYDSRGENIRPYRNACFRVTKVYPSKSIGSCPEIEIDGTSEHLFTAQPTIYQNQLEIIEIVDNFLKSHGLKVNELDKAIEYNWEGRGDFHILPPVVEKHSYDLRNGFFDLENLIKIFDGAYIKDAKGNLHGLSSRYLNSFFVDEISKIDYLDIFNSNASIINYGLRYTGKQNFYIICDGAHRIDYALEKLNEPITVILVEPEKNLIPYYAFPVTFRPAIRLSSKQSEKMYPRLERDKIHLLNDFINKTLHYDWSAGGLNVSKLRSNKEIY